MKKVSMKEKVKQNKKEIVEVLNEQVANGIEIVKKLNVDDNVYGIVVTNLLNAFKAAEQMSAEIEFDLEQEKLIKDYNSKQK